MPQNINQMVVDAKKTLAEANKKFPSPKAVPNAPVTKGPAKTTAVPNAPVGGPKSPSIADELKVKSDNVNTYMKSLPKMHEGGPVLTDGAYQLKAGEHVLTGPEAMRARKHAMMATGMRSLAKSAGQPKVVGDAHKG